MFSVFQMLMCMSSVAEFEIQSINTFLFSIFYQLAMICLQVIQLNLQHRK